MKSEEVNKTKQKTAIRCECGFIATGNSQKNARANLILHKKSKHHKKLISIDQDITSGIITDISGINIIKNK